MDDHHNILTKLSQQDRDQEVREIKHCVIVYGDVMAISV